MEKQQLPKLLVCKLGVIPFPDAMNIEHQLIKLISEGESNEVLLILEHPPTVTMGKFGNMGNVLVTREDLAQKGISFYDSDRGGDATFNCPGQIIVHPIINLKHRGARAYIADLDEMGSKVLTSYGIIAEKSSPHPGIWVKGKQIGAVGLRISHGVSMHGLSFNINPDLSLFSVINLCGLPGTTATSIENELGRAVSTKEVTQRLLSAFSDVFHVELSPISKERLTKLCSAG